MLDTYIRLVLERRWLVMTAAVALCVFAAAGLAGLGFTGDYRDFFKPDNPHLQAYEELEERYARSNNIFVAVSTSQDSIFVRETLEALGRFTAEAWRLPYVARVDSLTNFQYMEGVDDELRVRNLVDGAAGLGEEELSGLPRIARGESELMGVLLSDDLRVTGINLSITEDGVTDAAKPEVVAALRQALDRLVEDNPHLSVHLTGSVVIDHAMDVEAEKDLVTLYPIMYLVVIVFTLVVMRSLAATIATLVIVTLAVIATLGIMGWAGTKLTALSVATPTVIMTLTVAHCMHIVLATQDGMRTGLDKPAAIALSLRTNFVPVFLVTLTTVIGFIAMTTSEVPPLVDLGVMLAVGMVSAYLLSISFLPAWLAVFPLNAPARAAQTAFLHGLARFVTARYWSMITVLVVLMGVALAVIGRNEINDNFIEYFSDDAEIYRDSHFISDRLTGIHQIHYSIDSGQEQGIFEPDYLRVLDNFSSWLKAQPGVRHVDSVSETIKRLNREINGGDDAFFRLPESRELIAQYFFLYELSLPLGLEPTGRVDLTKEATRLTVTVDNLSSAEILALNEASHQWLTDNADSVMVAWGSGPVVMFANLGQSNASSLVMGTIYAMLLVSVVLAVALGSLRMGVICLIPNMVPILLAFGVWALIDGEIGLAVSVVTVMTFGIIVDDTIHFMSRYLAERRRNVSVDEAVMATFAKVGKVLVGTTVILVAGFLILTLSVFRLNGSLGLMTSMIIALALVIDLMFLPPLLKVLDGKRGVAARPAAAPA